MLFLYKYVTFQRRLKFNKTEGRIFIDMKDMARMGGGGMNLYGSFRILIRLL
ncbi:MAG: hypothetical protein ACJ75F_08545 [Flavisolibacter sp.]